MGIFIDVIIMATITRKGVTTNLGESPGEFTKRLKERNILRRKAENIRRGGGSAFVEEIGGKNVLVEVKAPDLFTSKGGRAESKRVSIGGVEYDVTEGFSRADLVKEKALRESDNRESKRIERLNKLDRSIPEKALRNLGFSEINPLRQPTTEEVIQRISESTQENNRIIGPVRSFSKGVKVKELYEKQDLQRAKKLQNNRFIADSEKKDVESLAKKLYRGRITQEARKREAINQVFKEVQKLDEFNKRQDKNVNKVLDYVDKTRVFLGREKFFDDKESFGKVSRKITENLNQFFNPYVVVSNIAGSARAIEGLTKAGITKELAKSGVKLTGKVGKEVLRLVKNKDLKTTKDYINKGTDDISRFLSKNLNPKTEKGLANLITLSIILRADKLASKGVKGLANSVKNNKKILSSLKKVGISSIEAIDNIIPRRLFASKSGRVNSFNKRGRVKSPSLKKSQRVIRQIKKPVSKVEKSKRGRAGKLGILTPKQSLSVKKLSQIKEELRSISFTGQMKQSKIREGRAILKSRVKSPRETTRELKNIEVNTLIKQSKAREGKGIRTPTEGQLIKKKKDKLLVREQKRGNKVIKSIKNFEFQSFKIKPKKKSVKITKTKTSVDVNVGGGQKSKLQKLIITKQKFDRVKSPSLKQSLKQPNFVNRLGFNKQQQKDYIKLANENKVDFDASTKKGFDRNKRAIEELKARIQKKKREDFKKFISEINKKVNTTKKTPKKVKETINFINKIKTGQVINVNFDVSSIRALAQDKKLKTLSVVANKLLQSEKQESLVEQASKQADKISYKPVSTISSMQSIKKIVKKPIIKPKSLRTKTLFKKVIEKTPTKIKNIKIIPIKIKKQKILRKPIIKKKKIKIKLPPIPKGKPSKVKLPVLSKKSLEGYYTPTLAGKSAVKKRKEEKLRQLSYTGLEVRA